MHMIAHGPGDADSARWAFRLKSRHHIHRIPVQVSTIRNRVAKVDPHAKPHDPLGRVVAVVYRHLLLHLHGTAHRAIYAVEHDKQRITAGLDDPATMLRYRRVY